MNIKLTERAFDRLGSTNINHVKDIVRELIHHIELQDKQIEVLKRKNKRLERKYWEIKLKYEEEI